MKIILCIAEKNNYTLFWMRKLKNNIKMIKTQSNSWVIYFNDLIIGKYVSIR